MGECNTRMPAEQRTSFHAFEASRSWGTDTCPTRWWLRRGNRPCAVRRTRRPDV